MSFQEKFNQKGLANKIVEMKQLYQQFDKVLVTKIETKTERYSEKDADEFNEFLQQLKQENLNRISEYMLQKSKQKYSTFEQHYNEFYTNSTELLQEMKRFKKEMANNLEKKSQSEANKIVLIDNMNLKIKQKMYVQKAFGAWKNWLKHRQQVQKDLIFCRNHYCNQLQRKTFLSWRSLSYRPAFESKVNRDSEKDVQQIQQHYLEIINVLKNKLQETEELIGIKRQAKSEFAYSLSRNLMKAISNLSMEVMNLNQVTLQDQRVDFGETQRFLKEINTVINSKCNEVKDVRSQIVSQVSKDKENRKVSNLITFSEPAFEQVNTKQSFHAD